MTDQHSSPPWWQALQVAGSGLEPSVLQASFELLGSLQQPAPDMLVLSDRPYGQHARHVLDLYLPVSARHAPVLLFVHGGGFVGGDKRMGPFFANIGAWAVRNGFIAATMNYRLAPEHLWPAAAEDVGAAVHWLRKNIETHGGDAERLFLFGHSAGAIHAASYVSSRDAYRSGTLRGLMLASGFYDLRNSELRPMLTPYFGERSATYTNLDFAAAIAATSLSVSVIVSELEPPVLHGQGLALATALTARDSVLPSVIRLDGHNHYSGVLAVNTPAGRQLEAALESFIFTR